METLDNVPLSCIEWKAHHKFHVQHVIIKYLQITKASSIWILGQVDKEYRGGGIQNGPHLGIFFTNHKLVKKKIL